MQAPLLPASVPASIERQGSASDFDTAEIKARPRFDQTLESDPPAISPRDLDQVVSEDSETFPTRSAALPMSLRGPRTVKRSYNLTPIILGRVIANRYRIESLVGAGGTGVVYKAAHVDLPRTIAIKVLHPHFRTDPHLMASFRTEARAASLLDHPNVAVVHDFGEEPDGLVYIVMEYIGGESLQAVLDRELRLTPRRAIDLMLQICAALSVAHDRGIVHRDVKPDNIMVVPSRDDEGHAFEHVKVCDFGIASLESAARREGRGVGCRNAGVHGSRAVRRPRRSAHRRLCVRDRALRDAHGATAVPRGLGHRDAGQARHRDREASVGARAGHPAGARSRDLPGHREDPRTPLRHGP